MHVPEYLSIAIVVVLHTGEFGAVTARRLFVIDTSPSGQVFALGQ